MEKNTIEDIFESLKGEFDIAQPKDGHKLRFKNKLNSTKNDIAEKNSFIDYQFNWKPVYAVAATVLLFLCVFIVVPKSNDTLDLASVSPELSETQDFFVTTIETELKRLNNERSPLTESIINDALEQIKYLENEYQNLKTDLNESGYDQRVIHAMISNFQNRIDILNTVLKQIDDVKQLNTNDDEFKNTI